MDIIKLIVYLVAYFILLLYLIKYVQQFIDFALNKIDNWLTDPNNKLFRHYEKDIYFNREYAAPPCSCKKFIIFTYNKKDCRRHN